MERTQSIPFIFRFFLSIQSCRFRQRRNTRFICRRRDAIVALSILIPIILVGRAIWFNSPRAKDVTVNTEALTGTAAQMRMAADFAAEKDYGKAESTYRLILKSEPNNRAAVKELASVLFRQQRYDEAAAVLKSLPPE